MSTLTPETAVQHCLNAYNDACARDDARNDHSPESLQRVHLAWRRAMPFLTPHPDAIDAFITCVTHGIVLGVFSTAEGSKLLYAAQVAIGSRRARQESARLQSKSKHPQIQSAEGAVAAPQVPPLPLAAKPQPAAPQVPPTPSTPPTNLPCPILAPGPIGGRVGDHETPTTPPPPPSSKPPAKSSHLSPNQLDALLEQLYAGHLPTEHTLNSRSGRIDHARSAPPTPSPSTNHRVPAAG